MGRFCRNYRALRILGRWMRMIVIPNQSSVAKACEEFDEPGRMKPPPYYGRLVNVMEGLVKFTLLTRDSAGYLVNRCSELKAIRRDVTGATHVAAALGDASK